MKKFLLSVAALVALSATASAQYPPQYPPQGGGYGPEAGGCANCDNGRSHRFGLHPAIRRLFAPSSHNAGGYGRNAPNMLPAAQGGQLAFPVNPFIRSPRDFFMMD